MNTPRMKEKTEKMGSHFAEILVEVLVFMLELFVLRLREEGGDKMEFWSLGMSKFKRGIGPINGAIAMAATARTIVGNEET